MDYQALITRVQYYSGLSYAAAKDALDCLVESVAIHLDETQRKAFASQLPEQLEAMALTVLPTATTAEQDVFEQFMQYQRIPELRAKRLLPAAWEALKEVVNARQLEQIERRLTAPTLALLA